MIETMRLYSQIGLALAKLVRSTGEGREEHTAFKSVCRDYKLTNRQCGLLLAAYADWTGEQEVFQGGEHETIDRD